MLQFGVMSALAGALLRPCAVEMGGWHFYGVTSGGKTTLLQCAASVWGNASDPQMGPEDTTIRKWASTAAGFESMAEAHNDTALCIDELEQAPKDELGKIIFLLAGGLSKSRSTVSGGLRPNKSWRVMICSSGEKSIKHQMSMQGDAYKGGKAVRIVDIPCDGVDGQRSIFSNCGGMAPELWGHRLKAHLGMYYGTAGPYLVRKIVEEAERIGWASMCEKMREFLILARDKLGATREDIPPEMKRVLLRFALVLVAGWYAQQWGIVEWSQDEMYQAVCQARDRWIENQGDERSEQDKALAHLRDSIIANEGRIVRLNLTTEQVIGGGEVDRLSRDGKPTAAGRGIIGFVNQEAFGFTASGFRELCGEFDLRMVVNTLRMQKFLLCESASRHTLKWPAIGEYRRQYLYTVKLDFMGEADPSGLPF
jgi:putative DNA primase/helicase